MKIVVCVRQSSSGEINPFDACAYEAALRIDGAEITLLSMAPLSSADFLSGLTRLGAKRAVLLSDSAFAGADTLATAYTLSLAIKQLEPKLIICGRQTVDGDTGQVGPELAIRTGYGLICSVMSIDKTSGGISCTTREGKTESVPYPALITVERINTLRLPSIRSRAQKTEILTAADIGADLSRCGLSGSPTRVVKTFENEQDRRKCRFITPAEAPEIIRQCLEKKVTAVNPKRGGELLENVWIVGSSPRAMAQSVSEDITEIPLDSPSNLARLIAEKKPAAVLWGSDPESKKIAPQTAALLNTGLCADCTALEADGKELIMYRPAFSGNIIAKIKCLTRPQMATVRTADGKSADLIIGVGFGAADDFEGLKILAERYNGEISASRKMVDKDYLPYPLQVGLTGKSVNPAVYIAAGISGAVHHIAGIRSSGTIIAVNRDKDAPIFKYADYGIIADISEFLNCCQSSCDHIGK